MNDELIVTSSLSKQVVRAVRRQIFSSAIKPGDRIVEGDIAKKYKISRGPVREAFVELEREGLVQTKPRKGTYVSSFTIEDIEEIYTLRALLEGFAVTRAIPKIGTQDLNKLRSILDEIDAGSSKEDIVDVSEKNMKFHEEIMKLSGHQRVFTTWKSLLAQIRMLSAIGTEFQTNIKDIRQHHEVLLDALIKKDVLEAKRCFEEHIIDAMQELVHYLRGYFNETIT